MKKILLVMVLTMMLVWGVGVKGASATYWTPTNSGQIDVNYVSTSPTFAIFDDSSSLLAGDNKLLLNIPADTIFFVASGVDFDLWRDTDGDDIADSNTGMTLTNSSVFQLGWSPDSGSTWYIDTSYTMLSSGLANIFWNTNNGTNALYQIDASPAAVPIPGAAWLLGSGLFGLVGIRRRKKK